MSQFIVKSEGSDEKGAFTRYEFVFSDMRVTLRPSLDGSGLNGIIEAEGKFNSYSEWCEEEGIEPLSAYPEDAMRAEVDYERYKTSFDIFESFLLALACAGIEMDSPKMEEAIFSAWDATVNHFS